MECIRGAAHVFFWFFCCCYVLLPSNGIASLVAGIVSATTCENTVNDRRIVTPEMTHLIYDIPGRY